MFSTSGEGGVEWVLRIDWPASHAHAQFHFCSPHAQAYCHRLVLIFIRVLVLPGRNAGRHELHRS